jgi:hypothetical protein
MLTVVASVATAADAADAPPSWNDAKSKLSPEQQ